MTTEDGILSIAKSKTRPWGDSVKLNRSATDTEIWSNSADSLSILVILVLYFLVRCKGLVIWLSLVNWFKCDEEESLWLIERILCFLTWSGEIPQYMKKWNPMIVSSDLALLNDRELACSWNWCEYCTNPSSIIRITDYIEKYHWIIFIYIVYLLCHLRVNLWPIFLL